MTTQFVTSKDGTRIAYETAGSGPVLLVVNGALGSRSLTFAKAIRDEFAKHFTVIDYDRRGRGESGDTQPFAVAREVEDIAALVKGPGGGSCFVFAQSSGAALALEAAASGVPMTMLVAFEPPYMVGDPKDRPDADFEARLWAMRKEEKRSQAVNYFMATVGVPAPFRLMMRLMPFWGQLKANAHTLPYDAAVMAGFELPARRLATIKVPVVAMVGAKSTPTLRRAAEAVATAVPKAKHQVAEGMSHAVNPKLMAPILAELFSGKPAKRA